MPDTVQDYEKELAEERDEKYGRLTVTGASHEKVVDAVNREDFPDFEDCLQVQCAKKIKADYIITRNVSDYVCSNVQAVTPKEFAEKMEQGRGR